VLRDEYAAESPCAERGSRLKGGNGEGILLLKTSDKNASRLVEVLDVGDVFPRYLAHDGLHGEAGGTAPHRQRRNSISILKLQRADDELMYIPPFKRTIRMSGPDWRKEEKKEQSNNKE
jgi:hypothetical protein